MIYIYICVCICICICICICTVYVYKPVDGLLSCKQRWHWNAAEQPISYTFVPILVYWEGPVLAIYCSLREVNHAVRLNSSWKPCHSAAEKTHGLADLGAMSLHGYSMYPSHSISFHTYFYSRNMHNQIDGPIMFCSVVNYLKYLYIYI